MNKFKLLAASLLLVSAIYAKKSIVISNTLNIDRKAEMVEIKIPTEAKSYVLKNSKGEEVGYQVIYNNNKPVSLIFQANVNAKSTSIYTLTEGKPLPVKAKTFGRFVPERKDDFAWENDLAAYRMYGPALAKENPSNGVDLWLKCTSELVVDKRYYDELTNGLSYHIDRGNGLDCYTVGHTLGIGGISPYLNGKLWVGNHYDSYKVLANGPLRTVFSLTYDSVKVGELFYKQTITITSEAGSILNKGVVAFSGATQKMELAAGTYLHDGKGILKQNTANGTSAYAEDAISNAKVRSGRNYGAVFIPSKVNDARTEVEHGLIFGNYNVGETFTYYFGGGWSNWKFPTDADWFKAVNNFAAQTKSPLKVKMK